MDTKYNPEESQQLDALDGLIIEELGQQQRLRTMMKQWDQQMPQESSEEQHALVKLQQDQRRRALRRLRLVPIVSNILSVAALMTVGFILHALLPSLHATTSISAEEIISTEQVGSAISAPADNPLAMPIDSAITR